MCKEMTTIKEKFECEYLLLVKDKSWNVYEKWGEAIDQDPRVRAIFASSANVIGTALCPKTFWERILCYLPHFGRAR
jgi:hypothetical protein